MIITKQDKAKHETVSIYYIHWNKNVVIMTKFSSLVALKVVILTSFDAANHRNFV